jgi:glucose-6-phosphate isomerase
MTVTARDLETAVTSRLVQLESERTLARLWDGDVTVWVDDSHTPEIADRLGWLGIGSLMAAELERLRRFADEACDGIDRAVLLGMGGSSLSSEVMRTAFGQHPSHPQFHVLDSTHPDAVLEVLQGGDLTRTLFVVASKSGTTIETDSLYRTFWDATGKRGSQFVAITDTGTALDRLAVERGFRDVFRNAPDIGGRYSALSFFGLVPAALMGIDLAHILERAERMADRCGPHVPPVDNPGAALGVSLAEAALGGRDKLTLLIPPPFGALGLWIEQLVAESTGKGGKGILPIAGEPFDASIPYRGDRMFVAMAPRRPRHGPFETRLGDIEVRQEPVARLVLEDPVDLGAECFRWEMATAVAGAVLRLNPFDQPNVAESKATTREVLSGDTPLMPPEPPGRSAIAAFLADVRPGDYVAVQAFMAPGSEADALLADVCDRLRERVDAAVTVGYGPRYLHSTGQLHKGGPACGHFLQLATVPTRDVAIPGREYGFARLITAQAAGDAQALRARGRPVLQIADPADLLSLL